jgi:hypothetical protein
MSLSDLDEMVLSCRSEEARNYVGGAGAFRACIVSTWIAVVFDLIAKIRELALSGDAAAQEIVNNLNSWQPLIEVGDAGAIKNSLEFERDVVRIANDRFGFFEGLQVLDSHRLRDDRNRCAHPTYQGNEQPRANCRTSQSSSGSRRQTCFVPSARAREGRNNTDHQAGSIGLFSDEC